MLKSSRHRLYPTSSQKEQLDKHIDAYRFVYNLCLETKNYAYISQRKSISCIDLINQLPGLKEECLWLKEVDSQALQQAVINLDKAFTQFFKSGSGYPKFKSKKSAKESFRSPQNRYIKVNNGSVFLPKIKTGIKIIQERQLPGTIKSATISRTTTGKYYISILCETGEIIPKKKQIVEDSSVGIDLGIKTYIATSEGDVVDNPKFLKNSQQRLKILQRRAAKKEKNSNNQKKAYKKIGLLHEKIVNQRKDFLQKLSTSITKKYDTICTEDLNIDGMMKNHNLAGAIGDAGWRIFVEMLKYKCEWYGKNLLQIPTFQASTKVCSNCGAMKQGLTLKDREWDCSNCGAHHNRDINAAKVIKQYCLTNSGQVLPGESVELSTMVEVMKQKDEN